MIHTGDCIEVMRTERLVDVLTEALHRQFGGDEKGGCDHDDSWVCREIAADLAIDFGERIVASRPQ